MPKQQQQAPRITAEHLARVGLVLVRRDPLIVTCATCGSEWQPLRWRGMRWWRCLKGCNTTLQPSSPL